LLNTLLGEERVIVTPVAGTTRDAIHTHYKKFNHEFLLIDTAGLRKKRKFGEDVEFYSNLRAIRVIEECDVCLLLLDAQVGMEAQDVNIFRLAERNKKGIVILVNKWDLIEKKTDTAAVYEKHIRRKIAPFSNVPILFISALNKQRIMKAVETAEKVFYNLRKRIPNEELEAFITSITEIHPPSSEKGKPVKIKRMMQIPASTPVFVIFCNLPKAIKESYKRFIENKFRERFDFSGVPIQIYFRKS
jgi:GTP-binding protein